MTSGIHLKSRLLVAGAGLALLASGCAMLMEPRAERYVAPNGSWQGMYSGGKPVITWDPPLNWDWPLEVGRSWTREQRMTIHAANRTIPYVLTQTVEAYEDVTVPAGTFKAFKVSTVTSLGDENLIWFSPELGIFVKQSLKRTGQHAQGPGTREIQLLAYKRGG
jgi:hypothetical protein